MSIRTGTWGRAALGAQVLLAGALVVACSRAPVGVEESRYDGAYRGSLTTVEPVDTAVSGTTVTRDVKPDNTNFQLPTNPYPGITNYYHVLDTNYGWKEGREPDIHRMATQWHNTLSQWWYLVPVNPPLWRGPYAGTAPAEETLIPT